MVIFNDWIIIVTIPGYIIDKHIYYSDYLSWHIVQMETGLLAILTFFIATKASEITSKTFGKFAVSDYTSLNVKNNVASRLRCASMCSGVQNSGCVAYVYELSTKICNMYSFVQIMPQAQGVLSAYVDISGTLCLSSNLLGARI